MSLAIDRVRNRIKVSRVDTEGAPAEVIDFEAVRNWPDEQDVTDPVRAIDLSTEVELAIAIASAHPTPARWSDQHFRHEPFHVSH
jgi:hypothetical protein